jgi:hypothetical protein
MKTLLSALLLTLLVAPTHAATVAQYQGKLDLFQANVNPQTIVDRDFTYGLWRAGLSYQAWHLQNNANGWEVLHVSGFWETGIDGKDKIYGARVGINLGESAVYALSQFEILEPSITAIGVALPPWASKLADWTSLDFGAAYAPGHAHVSALIGGAVTIPLSEVFAWAAGSNGQRGL